MENLGKKAKTSLVYGLSPVSIPISLARCNESVFTLSCGQAQGKGEFKFKTRHDPLRADPVLLPMRKFRYSWMSIPQVKSKLWAK